MLNPTEKLLLECVRSSAEDRPKGSSKKLFMEAVDIDWQLLAGQGFKVFLPFFLEINEFSKSLEIPVETEEIIKIKYISNIAKNEKIKKLILKIAREFNKAKVDLIFLKGAALLFTLYKDDSGVRSLADLDILTKKENISEAEDILRNIGCREDYEKLSIRENIVLSRKHYAKRHFHYVYFIDDILIELHWDISNNTNPEILASLFHASKKVTVNDVALRILSPEHSIFILCINFSRDFNEIFSRLRPEIKNIKTEMFCRILYFLYEIKIMLRYYKDTISWDNLLSLAHSSKNEYVLYVFLLLAQKIVKADIPQVVMDKIRSHPGISLYSFLYRNTNYEAIIKLYFYKDLLKLTDYRSFIGDPVKMAKSVYASMLSYLHVSYPEAFTYLIKRLTMQAIESDNALNSKKGD